METLDYLVVGGGILGLATARALLQSDPAAQVTVLEKESDLAQHQTGHNSGVIHSGLYYKPGSLKALYCKSGRDELVRFAEERGLKYELTGKVVVATKLAEEAQLEMLQRRGEENGLDGLKMLNPAQIAEIEPHCRGTKGLWVPQTGIIDYVAVTKELAQEAKETGCAQVICGQEATSITKENQLWRVGTSLRTYWAKKLVLCAGLQSDRWLHLAAERPSLRILPFRGDYYELTDRAQSKVNNLIYPVPDLRFPFLGVHFTRMIGGGVECGPNAVFAFKREGYHRSDFDLKETAQSLSFSGTWRLFARHWRPGLGELARAWSKRRFLASLQQLIPSLNLADIHPGRAGVRAQAVDQEGKLLDDFAYAEAPGMIQVLNAPSPAATSSLALGREVARRIRAQD